MKNQLSLIKHKALSLCLAALMGMGVALPAARVEAGVDPWAAAAQALGVYAAYKSSLKSVLLLGNDPRARSAGGFRIWGPMAGTGMTMTGHSERSHGAAGGEGGLCPEGRFPAFPVEHQ
ncbi:hypothetical protein [Selenomonas sp. AB3002]|uniref:hypothetical protein n=1 Tax=Selenomonas sp. AB3002 TaxID=1392502 RepID=UPI00296F7DA0